ncbi:MAG: hypothetical protein QM813_21195 [Verrucomicrobiota bacterium]
MGIGGGIARDIDREIGRAAAEAEDEILCGSGLIGSGKRKGLAE